MRSLIRSVGAWIAEPQAGYTLFSSRDIWKLLIPLIVEQLLFMLVGTADTLMVASLGDASISAVSLVDMFNNFIASILFALATGGAVVVSQYIGAGSLARAREAAKQLLVVALIAGAAVCFAGEIFLKEIVRIFYGNLEPDVHAATMSYFRITLAGLPFIAVYGGCAALFRSMNRARCTMYISFASNLINIAGNALLIFGCGLGVAGAAYATVLARLVSMAVILVMITDRSRMIYVSFRNGFRISHHLVRRILTIAIPSGIENGVFQFGRVIVLGLIASYGTREIAANAVANTVDYFGCILGNACGLAVITVIGQAAGAGDRGQIRHYVRRMMKLTWVLHFLWNVALFAVTPLLLKCFSKIDPASLHLAVILIIVHNGLGMFIWPFTFTFPHVLRSLNDVRWPMAISIGSMIVVRIGASYALAPIVHSGVIAVWIAMVLDWLVRIAGFLLRYRSGAWTRLIRSVPAAK